MYTTALIALVLVPLNAGWAADLSPTRQKSETFDRDPQWDGKNNRAVSNSVPLIEQDFGYSRSNRPGKAAGEIGGRLSPSIHPASYAKVIPNRTLDDPLSASGSLSLV